MNKVCHCTSIRLKKVKINLQLKRSLFSTNHELSPPKFFGADSTPNVTIKRSTKVQKSQWTPGDFERERENCHASHFGQDQRTLTPYQIKPRIPTLDQDCFEFTDPGHT